MNVVVYRSDKAADTYLYMAQGGQTEDLPEGLLQKFPAPAAFLEFELHDESVLVQADPKKVRAAISDRGFYLQLPPAKNDELLGD